MRPFGVSLTRFTCLLTKQMKKPGILIAGAFGVTAVLAITLQLMDARDAIHRQLESALTATFETPVTIGKLDISLLPDASITVRQIEFSQRDRSSHLSVEAVNLDVSFSQIWRGKIVIAELHLENLTGSLTGLLEYIARISEQGGDGPPLDIALRRIVASPVQLISQEERMLGPYELVFQFGPDGGVLDVSISRLDHSAILNIVRGDPGSLVFGFTARDWTIPYGPPLVFERVTATGNWSKDRKFLEIGNLQADAYAGSLTGKVQLGWGKDWQLSGQVRLENVDAGTLLRTMGRPELSGNLNWDGTFKLGAPRFSMLLSKPELDGHLALEQGTLQAGAREYDRSGNRKGLRFEKLEGRVRYKPPLLELHQLQLSAPSLSARRLGPYDINLQTNENGSLLSASLVRQDDRFKLLITAAENGHKATLRARNWTLPAGPPIRIDHLDLDGQMTGKAHLRINRINGRLYGGKIKGKGGLKWKNGWSLKLGGNISGVELEPLLATLDIQALAGRLYTKGETQLSARQASHLFRRPAINCEFQVLDGAIYEMDLQKAAQNITDDYITGGETPFEQFSGRLDLEKGMLIASDLQLHSKKFEAKGNLEVDPNDNLKGIIDVGLMKFSALVSIPIRVSGTTREPRLRPTEAALAGAAAGTAALGPGLGTVLGIKAGQVVRKLSDMLDRGAADARVK